ncbi:MAG: acetyl-CoA carboxylase biotin carboxyl carrier protein [Deltaproteobacteria bacterium]|nr:acetyl-CoA carboxylase biotin carboxyl carrier protein [Deltaproteobacteria bacterium]
MASVDLDKLRALIEVLTEKDVAEFEHETENARIRIVRRPAHVAAAVHHAPANVAAPAAAATAATAAAASEPASDAIDVTSPFVGTFYRSPSPEAPAFVEVGSVVRSGQTLCIVEAMKLMNEIEAEVSGTIVEIFAQNGKSVEFGQKLFRIKKA